MIDAAIATLAGYLPVFVLASMRVALTFAALPAPFGAIAPVQIRTAFSIMTTAALILPQVHDLPMVKLDLAVLTQAAIGEIFLGGVIGMTVRVTLAAAEMAGSMAGQAMGLGFASSVDPTQGESVLPTTYLFDSLATLIFLSFNGHHVLLAALAASFRVAPVGQTPAVAHSFGLINLGGDLVARGLQIAAPVIATMFIVQLGTAFVSRTAPRVHLFAFAFSVTIAAGMVVLWLAAPAVCTAIAVQVRHVPDALSSLGVF
ncbi:MAG TPA: flagellar biosynthetic protein FliR [Polyangiales bacterium]